MQINSGLRSILAWPWVYRLMAHILGNEAKRQWFIDDVLCPREGQKVVDVGCGPIDILERLSGVELASSIFPIVSTNIATSVNRLGYVSIVGQCRKSIIAVTSSS
jgi:hypothetical protein